MSRIEPIDDPIYEKFAKEIVIAILDTDANIPTQVGLLNDSGEEVVHVFSEPLARAVAQELLRMADEVSRHRPIRRLRIVDDRLRGLDG